MGHLPHETIKIRIGQCLEFTSENWLSPTKPQKSTMFLEKNIFLHSTPLNKILLEWAIHPIKQKKIDLNIVCIPSQKLAKSRNNKKSNKIDRNKKFPKNKSTTSRLCTKEHTCQIW